MRTVVLLSLLSAAGVVRAGEPAATVEASPAACAALVPGAAYVPGRDQAGNDVAPADLPPEPRAVTSDTISIEIDPRLAGKFGVPAPGAGTYGTRPVLGFVTVSDGKAYFNGKPLAPELQDALAAACKAARK